MCSNICCITITITIKLQSISITPTFPSCPFAVHLSTPSNLSASYNYSFAFSRISHKCNCKVWGFFVWILWFSIFTHSLFLVSSFFMWQSRHNVTVYARSSVALSTFMVLCNSSHCVSRTFSSSQTEVLYSLKRIPPPSPSPTSPLVATVLLCVWVSSGWLT